MTVTVTIDIGDPSPVIPTTARLVIYYGDEYRAEIVWTYQTSRAMGSGRTLDHYRYQMTREGEDGAGHQGETWVSRQESTKGWGYTPDSGPLTRAVIDKIGRDLHTVLAVDAAKEHA